MTTDNERRLAVYLQQSGRPSPTPRQRRRLEKKDAQRKHRSSGRR